MKALLTIKYPEEQVEKLKELGYDVVVRKGELSDEDYHCKILNNSLNIVFLLFSIFFFETDFFTMRNICNKKDIKYYPNT